MANRPVPTTTVATLPSTTTTTAAPAAPVGPQCSASDLLPSWNGMGDGASETVFFVVNLLNRSSSTCVTGGYVGVAAYDPAGRLIPASESRQLLGTTSPVTLSVAPGTTISFIVGFPDVDMADGGFP